MLKQTKRGIAMVELIFALVIMGIALMSAPMLIQQSIKSSNVALQQESIAALASHTGIVLTKYWDEGDANLSNGVAPIISLSNPVEVAAPTLPQVPMLPNVGNTPFGFAGIDTNVTGRTVTVSNNPIFASPLGSDGNDDFNDVDDYIDHNVLLTIFNEENSTIGELGDYVDVDINIATAVTFADDRPTGDTFGTTTEAGNNIFANSDLGGATQSNIKFITTRLTSNSDVAELQKDITLHAFSCNLGTYSLGGKQYQ